MRNRRTDLALEARELWQQSAGESTCLPGVKAWDGVRKGFPVTTVEVLNREGQRALGKPPGRYVTLTMAREACREEGFDRAVQALAEEIGAMLPDREERGPVLIAGLGNRAITPDAIGPLVHEYTLVTRHLVEQIPEHFGSLRPVASLAAGVMGTTGMESGEVIQSLCRSMKPALVVAVDALASRSLERLCTTVQIADTGIIPGSGVGNHRFALDRESLGVPVIAVGVPTVVEAATLAADLLDVEQPPDLGRAGALMVTPRDIDARVRELSKIIGYGLSLALQPSLTLQELELLLS